MAKRLHVGTVIGIAMMLGAGCSDSPQVQRDAPPPAVDAPPLAPAFRNPVTLSDSALAEQALKIIGGNLPDANLVCRECHAVNRQTIRAWRSMTDSALASCLTDTTIATPAAAQAALDCFRTDPANGESQFVVPKFGVVATAAHLDWFKFAFERAYKTEANPDGWLAQYELFLDQAGMPRNDLAPHFTQAEFDIVAEYFVRGLPLLDSILPVETQGPTTCVANISSALSPALNQSAQNGWRAVHRDNNLSMLGCQGATAAKDCLSTYATAASKPYGTQWDRPNLGTMRVLRELPYETYYWSRSSADGRFVAMGTPSTGTRGTIHDLQAARDIPANGAFDPGFLPDNTGFMYQSTTAAKVPKMCSMNLLYGAPTAVTFEEVGCLQTATQHYQHVGSAVTGDDQFIVSGCFKGDAATGVTLADPAPVSDANCQLQFDVLANSGAGFVAKPTARMPSPFEGDAVISPSSNLLVTRVAGPNSTQLGYVVRTLQKSLAGDTYTISSTEVARYCFAGAKPSWSYDDQWIVYHHYVGDADAQDLGFTGPADPAFAPYRTKGAANIYLLHVRTGARTRITNMLPGQYAVFPHFRADGWIYMVVKDRNRSAEAIVASPAALYLE